MVARRVPSTPRSETLLVVLLELLEDLRREHALAHPEARDEQDAVEVVQLVLDDPGMEVRDVLLDARTVEIEGPDHDLLVADDVPADTRDGKAALLIEDLPLRRGDLGVDVD